MTLRAAVGETVHLHFLALHADRISPYIGLSDSDFTTSLTLDDDEVTGIDVTVEEVDSTGRYNVSFVPNAEGFWWVQIKVNPTNDWYGESVRVRGYIGAPVDPDVPLGESLIYENNIIYLTLDRSIAALDGATLGEDYTAYFTTTYNPLYASVRQVRLEIGPFVTDVTDDTINLAIFEASLEANANSFQSSLANSSFYIFARHKYSLLLSELILLRALSGDLSLSGKLSKTLGDLTVSRGGNLPGILKRAEQIEAELNRWLKTVQSGGDVPPYASMRPGYARKGINAEDAFITGRQWEPTSGFGVINRTPAGNAYRYSSLRRDLKTFRRY